MAFQNVIMPDVTTHEMRGVWGLLALLGNPKAREAQAFLEKLSAEKDAAAEHHANAKAHRDAAELHAAEAKTLHEEITGRLAEAERVVAQREAAIVGRAAELSKQEEAHQAATAEHAATVAAHKKAVAAHRENVATHTARTDELDRALKLREEEVTRRETEFHKLMAPVHAAAKLVAHE
jgi:chromosome segregation ATPase